MNLNRSKDTAVPVIMLSDLQFLCIILCLFKKNFELIGRYSSVSDNLDLKCHYMFF